MYYVVRSNRQTVFYCAVDDGRACFYRISQIFEIVSCKFPRPVDQIIPYAPKLLLEMQFDFGEQQEARVVTRGTDRDLKYTNTTLFLFTDCNCSQMYDVFGCRY